VNLSSTLLRSRRAAGAAALVAAALLWVPAAPASAGFGIALRPAHADPGDQSTRAYFKPTVAPGGTFTDEVIVTNTGDTPLELAVSGVDGLTAATSGAVYGNRQDPVKKAGAWVSAAAATVTVAPHTELPVPFTVKVPRDAAAGDHLAGIAFEDVHPTSAGSNFAVTQVVRAVMGVQVVVPGPGAFGVHVDNATLQSLPGVSAASVLVTLGNSGARLGKPGLSVALSGPNGYQRTVSRTLDTILPGDTIAYPFAWPDVLRAGDYSITATATPGAANPGAPGGSPVVEGATVVRTVSAHLGTPLAGVPASGVIAPAPARHSSGGFPMWVVVVLVAAAGIGGGLYVGRRGRGSTPPADERALATERASRYPVDR
jgi:Bacterial protein of unknown function (DUF916)